MANVTLISARDASSHQVVCERLPEGTVRVRLEDRELELWVHWDTPTWGWARNLQTGEVHAVGCVIQEDEVYLWLDGGTYRFTRQSPQAKRRQGGAAGGPASGDVKAPMPGAILKVLVSEGETVEANTPLVLMESMKMEMSLTAPIAGVVSAVACSPGQMVEMNMVLIQLRQEGADGSENA